MKRTLLLFGFILCTLTGWSQRVTIQGHVTDGKEPVIGATVQVLGSNSKTVTDVNGNYKIQAPVNSTLQFNYIGFSPVKKKVRNGKNTINIQLTEDLQKMDEVVVTALNIKRNRRSLGYSTEQVDQKDLNVGNDANMLNQLTGKVAGVQITAGNSGAGSSSRVVIRGENSFSTNNQPLYVVDGVPIENNTFNMLAGTPQQIDYGNGAGELNPDDIASITVLKGANAAALYGSRAANGVILITSKSGTGKDKFRVDVNSTTTFENVARLPEYQNKYSQGLNGVFEYWDGANGHGGQDQQDMSWAGRWMVLW